MINIYQAAEEVERALRGWIRCRGSQDFVLGLIAWLRVLVGQVGVLLLVLLGPWRIFEPPSGPSLLSSRGILHDTCENSYLLFVLAVALDLLMMHGLDL